MRCSQFVYLRGVNTRSEEVTLSDVLASLLKRDLLGGKISFF